MYITKPTIYLVSQQNMDMFAVSKFMSDEETSWNPDSFISGENIPELAGRICYMSFGDKKGRKTNKEYLGHILDVGHGSVLEHAVFGFIFSGVSRSLSHELVRHRAGFGYSQLSQRYVDEKDADFVIPPAFQGNSVLESKLKDCCEMISKQYQEMTTILADTYVTPEKLVDFAILDGVLVFDSLNTYKFTDGYTNKSWTKDALIEACSNDEMKDYLKKKTGTVRRKSAREAARCVLPNATETKIYVTANARALRHFLELRGSTHAEAEIRYLACELCKVLQTAAPNLFGDYKIIKMSDGSETIKTEYTKV